MLLTISGLTVPNSINENDMIRESQMDTDSYKDLIIREYVYFLY